jgi:hypothetical protein
METWCCRYQANNIAVLARTHFENEQHELTKPTVQLIGRNQSGANRAAQAKECPEGMSHSLALAFWQRIQIRLRSLDLIGELQFPQLAHELASLSASVEGGKTMRPDYQPV